MSNSDYEPKIYLLPNLMTAGNLFCGFLTTLQIIEGLDATNGNHYYIVIGLILGACFFDLLDGRVARIGGQESDFGREFDSLADIVSFGIAPALLVYDLVDDQQALPDRLGWIIAFVYLLCGGMRLARFNCIAILKAAPSKHFQGIPIPAAAGVISSLTLIILWLDEGERDLGPWIYVLPALLILLSYLMFSNIPYPSFKTINWRTRRSLPWVFAAILILAITVIYWQVMPAIIFVSYMAYGLVRPWVSKRWRAEIELEANIVDDHPKEIPPAASLKSSSKN